MLLGTKSGCSTARERRRFPHKLCDLPRSSLCHVNRVPHWFTLLPPSIGRPGEKLSPTGIVGDRRTGSQLRGIRAIRATTYAKNILRAATLMVKRYGDRT
jgi:hypothetical protein